MSTMLKEIYDALKEAGASEEKASAAAVAVSAYQLDRANLATKEDIARLEKDIARLGGEIADLRLATKADLAELKADLIKWMVGIMGFMTTLFVVIVKFV